MAYRTRLKYTAAQKAEMWDRWQRGDSLHAIAGRLTAGIRRFSAFWRRREVSGHHPGAAPGWR
jgi:hypothetical protein